MKTYLHRIVLISCLLSLGLNGCTRSAFDPGHQQTPNIWVTAKVEPLPAKKANASRTISNSAPHQAHNPDPAVNPISLTEDRNLWHRIAQGFQIPIPEHNPAIQRQIAWFQQHQSYLNQTAKRAAPYMYLIYEQARQRNLAPEVVLLPIVESAYYPLAYSGAGAAGLWQLMPGTASQFGLKRNWWYDGRRDIFASTNAALDYLSYLQNYFNGNWLLVFAAYHAGEGTVQAAIRQNEMAGQDTDFWSLKLPQETMNYVPRMLALATIVKNPHAYHLSLPPIEDKPYLGKVDIGSQIKLADAARLADISLSELKQLNPGYNRGATVPNGPSHLLLPLDKIAAFKEKLSTLPRVRQTSLGRYKIQRGDTIAKIAERYNTSPNLILRVNRLRSDKPLPQGKVILVPAVSHAIAQVSLQDAVDEQAVLDTNLITPTITQTKRNTDPKPRVSTLVKHTDTTVAKAVSSKPSVATLRHKVKAGQTLSHIARQYHVSIKQLAQWNQLNLNKPLKPGLELLIKAAPQALKTKPAPQQKPAAKRRYIVRNGDTLSKVSRNTGVSVTNLKRFNQLKSDTIKPGMALRLSS